MPCEFNKIDIKDCEACCFSEAIEIVKQVAEEYSNSEIPNMSEKPTSSDGKDTNVRSKFSHRNHDLDIEASHSKDELIIHVMHGYDTLESPDGESCFGCYLHGKHEIYIADNIPTDQLFHTIAHEYMHYLQDIEGREFNEEEADNFAWSVFTPCYQQGKKDLAKDVIEMFESEKNREKPFSVTNLLWRRAIDIVNEEVENEISLTKTEISLPKNERSLTERFNGEQE